MPSSWRSWPRSPSRPACRLWHRAPAWVARWTWAPCRHPPGYSPAPGSRSTRLRPPWPRAATSSSRIPRGRGRTRSPASTTARPRTPARVSVARAATGCRKSMSWQWTATTSCSRWRCMASIAPRTRSWCCRAPARRSPAARSTACGSRPSCWPSSDRVARRLAGPARRLPARRHDLYGRQHRQPNAGRVLVRDIRHRDWCAACLDHEHGRGDVSRPAAGPGPDAVRRS